MTRRVQRSLAVSFVSIVALLGPLGPNPSHATDDGLTTLDVNGEQVRVYRDEFGVPHIFAETNRGLFETYGYTVAEDRLWQLELNRRAARGRLAEVFGTTQNGAWVRLDTQVRLRGYTDAALGAQFEFLTAEEQEIIDAYSDGINRYLRDVVAPEPATKLPYEFHHLGIGTPQPWTRLDVVANIVYQARFGTVGGTERNNQSLLAALTAPPPAGQGYEAAEALEIFNDLRWINDPDAPTSVPVAGAIGKRQKPPPPHPDQLLGASDDPPNFDDEQAEAALRALGVPTSLGSHGWVISPANSADGSAMLFGGPQVTPFSVPEVVHEVQLHGGNGFNVVGFALAGVPAVLVGRTDHIAWTLTSRSGRRQRGHLHRDALRWRHRLPVQRHLHPVRVPRGGHQRPRCRPRHRDRAAQHPRPAQPHHRLHDGLLHPKARLRRTRDRGLPQ